MPRILITDDDPAQLRLSKLLLEAAGHEVLIAHSPWTALNELKREPPDLLITDLRLSNAEGVADVQVGMDLIRRVHAANAGVPVIVLSGWPADLYGQPEEQMVSRVIVKPVPPRELYRAIDELTAH